MDAAATGSEDGNSWSNALTDLNLALCVADTQPAVSEIRVAGGVYAPTGPDGDRAVSFELLNGIVLRGGYAGAAQVSFPDDRDPVAYETILSGDLNGDDAGDANREENSYHVVVGDGTDSSAVIEGFTISGGDASGPGGNEELGGGMYTRGGSPTVRQCIFYRNVAAGNGGGMYNADGSSPLVTDCVFLENSTDNWDGAGMYNYVGADAVVIDCSFIRNVSPKWGGGMHNYDCAPRVTGCRFIGNTAGELGGGIYISVSGTVVANCMFSGNSAGIGGGGVFHAYGSTGTLTNCTLAGNAANTGGGGTLNFDAALTMTNCVVWGNSDETGNSESAQIYVASGTVALSYSCIENWSGALGGVANIGDDPLFLDADGPDNVVGTEDDNLRTALGSPVNDAGDSAALPADVTDLDFDGNTAEPIPFDVDGAPRLRDDPASPDSGVAGGDDEYVDMGAYEAADCNLNGVPDYVDIEMGASEDLDENGVPDECIIWDDEAGDDLWSTGQNWETDSVPGIGNPAVKEAVVIQGAGVNVILDVNASVDSVLVRRDTTLNLNDVGDLIIDTLRGIRNNGELIVDDAHAIIAAVPTVLQGEQPITLAGATASISSQAGGDVIANRGTIAGEGIIDAAFANQGRVTADVAAGTLSIAGVNGKTNDGVLGAVGSGTLDIATGVLQTSGGIIEAGTNGFVELHAPVTGDGTLAARHGGQMDVFEDAEAYTLQVEGGGVNAVSCSINFGNGVDLPPPLSYVANAGQLQLAGAALYGTDGMFVRNAEVNVTFVSTIGIAAGPVVLCPAVDLVPGAVAVLTVDSTSRGERGGPGHVYERRAGSGRSAVVDGRLPVR